MTLHPHKFKDWYVQPSQSSILPSPFGPLASFGGLLSPWASKFMGVNMINFAAFFLTEALWEEEGEVQPQVLPKLPPSSFWGTFLSQPRPVKIADNVFL